MRASKLSLAERSYRGNLGAHGGQQKNPALEKRQERGTQIPYRNSVLIFGGGIIRSRGTVKREREAGRRQFGS